MKKYLFGIFAIALAIGFSAFTTKKVSKSSMQWFEYDKVTPLVFGQTNATALAEAKDQNNYSPVASECDGAETELCRIAAEEDPFHSGKPLIVGQSIESELENYDAGVTFQDIKEVDN